MQHTAKDIVALVRATNGSEFAMSGSEAELLVNLFASAAASDAAVKATEKASSSMLESFDKAVAIVVGDHQLELVRS